jgi:crossover junction endodeoxyribonuclease RusA
MEKSTPIVETTFTLPYPVSVNGAFKMHNGARLSKAYRAWRDAAGLELISQRPRKHLGRVEASIRFRAPDRRRRDADNLLKAVLDLCVKHGVIVDDSNKYLDGFDVRWVDQGAPVTVTIRSLS